MGLPMWRAPSPEPKDALKKDPTANARSPIRRRRPARSPTSPRHIHNAAVEHHLSPPDDYGHALSVPLPPLYTSNTRARSRPPPPPPAPESPSYWRREPSSTAPAPPPEDAETRSLFRISTHAPRGLSMDHRRPLPALTPNFAPATASRTIRHSPSRHDSPIDSPDRSTYRSRSPWDSLRAERSTRRSRVNSRPSRRNVPDGPLPSSSLRESWSPTTTVDGLGDRDRSLTPAEESSHWEPFLSSVVPDPRQPTAESSFTSAAASASFSNSQPSSRASSSNSNSVSSSRTHITVPSRSHSFTFEQFLRHCESSEDDGASDTEEEEDDDVPSSLRPIYTRNVASRVLENPYRQSENIRNQARDSAANVRSFYGEITVREPESQVEAVEEDHLDGSGEEQMEERGTTEEELSLDQELRDARALLERLTRRDDISDEFWASVGLRRPLERIQQREHL